jgi:hypothetical protein
MEVNITTLHTTLKLIGLEEVGFCSDFNYYLKRWKISLMKEDRPF